MTRAAVGDAHAAGTRARGARAGLGLVARVGRVSLAAPLLLVARPPAGTAQTPHAGAVLARAVAAYGRMNTLRANFVQYVRDPMLGGSDTSWGEFLRQAPGKFAFRWRRPAGDLIVSDGQVMWVYLPSSAPKQVARTVLSGRPGESADVVDQFLDQPERRFTVTYVRADSVAGHAADVLALVPRQGNLPYTRVLIWVDRDDSLVRRADVSEGSGALRRIIFDHIRVNTRLSPSTFVFRVPAGVRVVDTSQ
jgi:outer membrane lipoprotein carrier protein